MAFTVFPRRALLGLTTARRVIDAALADARSRGLQPMTVAVFDLGGCLISADSEDGSGTTRLAIASGKALGALGFGVSSGTLAGRMQGREAFVSGVAAASDGRLVPAAGGVLVLDDDGCVIAAVGASGDSPDNDQAVVLAGLAAAGLRPGLDAASHD